MWLLRSLENFGPYVEAESMVNGAMRLNSTSTKNVKWTCPKHFKRLQIFLLHFMPTPT
jgi:hypothetical protein